MLWTLLRGVHTLLRVFPCHFLKEMSTKHKLHGHDKLTQQIADHRGYAFLPNVRRHVANIHAEPHTVNSVIRYKHRLFFPRPWNTDDRL